MSNLDKRILYIDYDHADIVDNEGAIAMQRPSISYGGNPTWQLNFVRVNNDGTLSGIDLSEVVSYNAAIDTDFLSSTMPMVRSLDSDIDHSQAASGIISVSLNAGTETFFAKVDGRNTVPAFFEIRGRDSEDKCILDYRFPINALGAIDPQGGDPIPIPSGGVTINEVYALLRAQIEYEFSDDGTNWHGDQRATDTYYRTRYPQGEWGEAISIQNGQDAPALQIKYSDDNSSWSSYGPTPTSSSFYMAQSVDGGSSWISGILFHGQNGTNGTNGVGFRTVGAYNDATIYHPYTTSGYYEVVVYDGSTYAYINETASSGHAPTGSSDSYWQLLAAKGDPGSVDNITVSDITDFDSVMSGILSSYAKTDNVYSISQTNDLLNTKANADNVYTQNEADDKFVDVDEFERDIGSLVTLQQWNSQNATFQGEIDYLSGVISGGGGGDLSLYTPLSTTQSISGTLQNEINTLSGNVPSSAIEGVNLNNERTLQVSNIAWVLAMPMRTTMPNANDTDQNFIFYVGDTNATYTKAHLYEKVADASATPPSEDDILISIPDYAISDVTLVKTNGYWYGSSYAGDIKLTTVTYTDSHCVTALRYAIYINSVDPTIISENAITDELPWDVWPWIYPNNAGTTVIMSHSPHGGGSRTYHWEDISPWASNS